MQHHEAHRGFALDVVGDADGTGFQHLCMADQDRLHFCRADALAGHVQGVVGATGDGPEAFAIDDRPVTVYPGFREAVEVRVLVALRFLPEAVGHADPWLVQRQFAQCLLHRQALAVADLSRHSRHAAVEGHRGNRLDQHIGQDAAADLGAAGIVDDRITALANGIEQPQPGLRVPRLAGRGENAQGAQVMALGNGITMLHQRAHQGR
ncbi:hypothetical protein D3C85_1010480 [compost metagenome]